MRYIDKKFCLADGTDRSFEVIEEKDFDDLYGAYYLAVTDNNNGFVITELDINVWLRHEMIYDCTEIHAET